MKFLEEEKNLEDKKGTGRARHGSIRSPLWRKGGVVFGPTPKINYYKKLNKNEKKIAKLSAIHTKLINKQIIIVDKIECKKISTKVFFNKVNNIANSKKTLIILDLINKNLFLSMRNLKNIQYCLYNFINANTLLRSDLLLVDEKTYLKIEQLYKEKNG